MDIRVRTRRRCEIIDITKEASECCRQVGGSGLLQVYCPHTTAGIAVNENADPSVKEDVLGWLERAVPRDDPRYRHAEGNADAHIKAILTGTQTAVPYRDGTLLLGRWQGVFLMEFDGPRTRKVWVQVISA